MRRAQKPTPTTEQIFTKSITITLARSQELGGSSLHLILHLHLLMGALSRVWVLAVDLDTPDRANALPDSRNGLRYKMD